MKKFVFYICALLLVMVLVFTYGCSCGANVPVRYPMMELPKLEPGMNSSIIIDDIIEVPANELWHKTVEIPDTVENVTIAGWFVASGGARNDIKALFLDDIGFHNWRNFSEVKNQPYQSEKISVDNFTAEINTPGKYHLIFSNWFSEFSTKKVIAKVYLYWSVKPVTYKIKADNTILDADDKVLNANDFKISASANVTFEFTGGGGLPDFKVSQDKRETYINANKMDGSKLWFIAPPYTDNNTYDFSFFGNTVVKGKIIAAAPSIGRGLMVSSSMANAPPHIDEKNTENQISEDPTLGNFTIEAIDPDDDELTYYAFNIPAVPDNWEPTNGELHGVWHPIATMNASTGEFSWNGTAVKELKNYLLNKITDKEKEYEEEYWIHFEVSDGILLDQWEWKLGLKIP